MNQPATSILNGYNPDSSHYDEMYSTSGQVQPQWQFFINTLEKLGYDELGRRQQEIRRQLRENGVTYNVHGANEAQRTWALDAVPFIIDQPDWQVIEAGITQRAELFNLILADIYGPRALIKQGLLPMELIFSHAGFLRQCDGVTLPSERQLVIYGVDLARGPDGRMWVLGDRTQAPSGAGYALENRTVMARVMGGVFNDHKIYRLSNFFRELQSALAELAVQQTRSPRIVVLTPGPFNETYFEHAYLASYLGYSLVQGDDLTVRDGAVALKSLEGLQPVNVILRRVDDLFCDPLELREDSRLGVAGLLEAARRQNVAIANPLGSSALENPGLIPFLPGLAKYLLGEDLILPSTATWWCGQLNELDYVLNNLDKLVIKKLARQPGTRTIFGSQLSQSELNVLKNKIKAQPQLYVGQEQVSFSTSPSFINGRLEPRHVVLRCFLVAKNKGYAVMPGGLTRAASNEGEVVVSNQAGGISKDTWILTNEPQRHTSLWLQTDRIEQAYKSEVLLPSRAAENLFWVGRYAERSEATARLLRVVINNLSNADTYGDSDETEARARPYLLRALTHVTMTYPGFVGKKSEERLAKPWDELISITLDEQRVGSLVANLQSMVNAAYTVRDLWSTDTWRVINDLEAPWSQLKNNHYLNWHQIQNGLNQLITTLMAFAGLNTESMTHEAGWLLLDIGRRLERALLTTSLIRGTLGIEHNPLIRDVILDAVLRATENVITYRRRYRSYLQTQTVLDLLLLASTNPRSLLYQLERLQEYIAQLPRPPIAHRLSEEERLILQATTSLRLSNTRALTETVNGSQALRLDEFMAYQFELLSRLSGVITQYYFTHTQAPHQLLSSAPPQLPAEIGIPEQPGE